MTIFRKFTPAVLFFMLAASPAYAVIDKADFKAVGDTKEVTLDPAQSYVIVRTNSGSSMFSFPLTFLRLPDPEDVEDYRTRRAAALEKAHAKWTKKHASWQREYAGWQKLSANQKQAVKKPVEPVEPNDGNLAFPTLDQENMVTIGPFNRFAKGDGRSIFLHRVPPGRYVFYANLDTANPIAGNCMCMGTIQFEVGQGQIVDAGMLQLNWFAERDSAKAAGRKPPKSDFEFAPGVNAVSWVLPEKGAVVDPRLSAYTITPASFRAYGRTPNYYGVQVDRLTAIPGILDYRGDQILQLRPENSGDSLSTPAQ
jgi:hypothetical protein